MRILVSLKGLLVPDTLKLLVEFGGNIAVVDKMGNTLLYMALSRPHWSFAEHNFKRITETFVDLGADVSIKNSSNTVPLRLAIDSKIPLKYVMRLIPSANILNDDSCWDGPFTDYVLESSARADGGKFFTAVLEAGANHVSKETLMLAIRRADIHIEHVEHLLTLATLSPF